jgi:predicted nuclease of predicted toxin-antitoxin system
MILADESLDGSILRAIRALPLNVLSVQEHFSGISDEEVIRLARQEGRIILTEDKDFGAWVFAGKVKDVSVILLRYHSSEVETMLIEVTQLLRTQLKELVGKFTVVTVDKIRSRTI